MVDYFDQPIAVDPTGNDGVGTLVPNAEFQVFAGTDLSFMTPLAVYEAVSGAEIDPLVSSSVGQLPQFRVEGDPEFVILKSGQFEVRLRSVFGAAKQAVADAGLGPDVIAGVFQAKDDVEGLAADVTTAVGTATDAATAAGDFATAASTAASDAQTSKEAVQAVVATNDGIMAPILASPTTASGAVLKEMADRSSFGPAATAANTQRFLTKLYRGVEDANLLFIGTSLGNETIEYVNLFSTQFAPSFPTHTFIIHGWDETGGAVYDTGSAGPATTIQVGTGPRTVHIWRACAAGMRTDYLLGSRWQAAVVATNADLVFVEHGKNEGSLAAAGPIMWRGQYLALTEALSAALPYAGIVLILEPLNWSDNDMALKNRVYEEIAQLRGYGIVNTHDAFLATGHPLDYLKPNDIHPTTSADAPRPNGSQLMADCLLAAMRLDIRSGAVHAQQTSSLTSSAPQLLSNGSFAAFGGAVPDGFVVSGATVSKDTRAGYFESPNGYAVRLQATGAAQSLIRGDIPVAPLRGKHVTLAVKLRIPAGSGGTRGRISLTDGVSNVTSSSALSHARDGFHYKILTIKVADNAAYLRAIVYGDTAASAAADITIDSISVVEGVLPRLGAQGAPGPAGPAGSGDPSAVPHMSTIGTDPLLTALAGGSVTMLGANQAILVPVKPSTDISVAFLEWVCAVQSGNYDIGLYDDSGARLWSKGSTAFPAANASQVETVSPAVAMLAGTRYWLAFTADNTTGSPRGFAAGNSGFMSLLKMKDGSNFVRLISGAFPLPETVVIGGTGSYKAPAVVFRSS